MYTYYISFNINKTSNSNYDSLFFYTTNIIIGIQQTFAKKKQKNIIIYLHELVISKINIRYYLIIVNIMIQFFFRSMSQKHLIIIVTKR